MDPYLQIIKSVNKKSAITTLGTFETVSVVRVRAAMYFDSLFIVSSKFKKKIHFVFCFWLNKISDEFF
jgi:hypothetical protein